MPNLRRWINKVLKRFGLLLIKVETYEELIAWADYGRQGPDRFFGRGL